MLTEQEKAKLAEDLGQLPRIGSLSEDAFFQTGRMVYIETSQGPFGAIEADPEELRIHAVRIDLAAADIAACEVAVYRVVSTRGRVYLFPEGSLAVSPFSEVAAVTEPVSAPVIHSFAYRSRPEN